MKKDAPPENREQDLTPSPPEDGDQQSSSLERPSRRNLYLLIAAVVVAALLVGDIAGFFIGRMGRGSTETTTTLVVSTTSTSSTTTTSTSSTTTTTAPQQALHLRYATTYSETDAGGATVQRFCDYIEDATSGAVTFDVYFDGMLARADQELALCSSGEADMVSLSPSAYVDQLPLLNFPLSAPGGAQVALNYVDGVCFDEPATSAVIDAEATAQNVKYLGFLSGGGSVFLARKPFAKLADLVGRKFGVAGATAAYESLGYTVVEMLPADGYAKLGSGEVEATRMDFLRTIDLKWYESAKYYMWDGTYSAVSPFTINLATWKKLTPGTQKIFLEAAADAARHSVQLDTANAEAGLQVLADAGVTVGTLSSDDQAAWYAAYFKAAADEAWARAVDLGVSTDERLIIEKAARLTGQTWSPPAPK